MTTHISQNDRNYIYDDEAKAAVQSIETWGTSDGGIKEITGQLLGKVERNTFIIMDSYALPVEGTETRVNPQMQAYAYLAAYKDVGKALGRNEETVGWYHSHPNFSPYMSGIDCNTQSSLQLMEPALAIVVDHIQTSASGRVQIGAFRTYPPNYVPPEHRGGGINDENNAIPQEKIAEFGANYNKYYKLNISYFRPSTDAQVLSWLQNRQWINALATTQLTQNREYYKSQITDLTKKIRTFLEQKESKNAKDQLKKSAQRTLAEQANALAAYLFKYNIFRRLL